MEKRTMDNQQKKGGADIAYSVLIMLALLVAASIAGYVFRVVGFPETNIVIVYLLCVLLTSRMTRGYIFGIIASVLATGAFNYFFIEPYFAFFVNASNYVITFVIMTMTALITSTLTSHAKQSALQAHQKEAETKALYTLTNRITEAADLYEIAVAAISTISDVLYTQAACLCFGEDGVPENTFIQQRSPERQERVRIPDAEEIKKEIARSDEKYVVGAEFYDWPIHGKEAILGIIRIPKEHAETMSDGQASLLHSMVENTALAMDRFWAMQQRTKSHREIAQERYRGNLLRAISHDLRTPLSGIMGTSEMLMDMTQRDDPRYSLAQGIHKDANWLHAMVENILNLTRLQDGKLMINKQMEAVEEIVGGAVGHVSRRSPEHEITVNVPGELLLAPMDARLIEQVLINLLDNALKHTLVTNPISISVTEDTKANCAIFSVADRGAGIAAPDLPNLFNIFYTSQLKHTDAHRGIGLGLAICDAIIKAHGGSIKARNRIDGPGAEFVFTLPLEGDGNELL